MSQQDGFDRSIALWLDSEARPAGTADVLERALWTTSGRRPRPRAFAAVGSHWVGEGVAATSGGATLGGTGLRTSVALLLLLLTLVLVLIAGAVVVGAGLLRPAPTVDRLGHLAYATADGLYVADWDGRNPQRILAMDQVPGPEECRGIGRVTWSPDGRHLAFRTQWSDACEGLVVVTDADGSSVTSFPGKGWSVAWSPDSRRIVTWVDLWRSIAIHGVDGERQALLGPPRQWISSGDWDPSWARDGTAPMLRGGVVVPLDAAPPFFEGGRPHPHRAVVSSDGTMYASPEGNSIAIAAIEGASRRVLGPLASSAVVEVMWSPAGDRIAFDVHESTPRIVDVATGVSTSLGLPSGDYVIEKFSPDGDRVLLESFRDSSLWSAQADGSGARRLVADIGSGDWQWLPPSQAQESASPGPTPKQATSDDLGIFAPVAGRIVFGDAQGIWGIDPAAPSDPAATVQLAEPGIPLGWSSDGTRLLMARRVPSLVPSEGNLFVLHADGSERQLTEGGVPLRHATISPDGSRVVYVASGVLYSVDADRGPAERLLYSRYGFLRNPTFSPDGSRIAYVDGRGDWGHSVWVADADGGNVHQILANETTDGAGHADGLAWSPDGGRLALGLEGSTYTFAADGSGFAQVIAQGDWPSWSPDGSQLAYTTTCLEDPDGCGLAVADSDGSNTRVLPFGTSGPWHPVPR